MSTKAAIEALLKIMPSSEAGAMKQTELEKAVIPTKTTGQRALRHLLETGQIQLIGEGLSADRFGGRGKPFRYFLVS